MYNWVEQVHFEWWHCLSYSASCCLFCSWSLAQKGAIYGQSVINALLGRGTYVCLKGSTHQQFFRTESIPSSRIWLTSGEWLVMSVDPFNSLFLDSLTLLHEHFCLLRFWKALIIIAVVDALVYISQNRLQ